MLRDRQLFSPAKDESLSLLVDSEASFSSLRWFDGLTLLPTPAGSVPVQSLLSEEEAERKRGYAFQISSTSTWSWFTANYIRNQINTTLCKESEFKRATITYYCRCGYESTSCPRAGRVTYYCRCGYEFTSCPCAGG